MQRVTLGEIADFLNARFAGAREREVSAVRALTEAGPDDLTFLANPKYKAQLETTAAAGILVSEALEGDAPNWLRVKDPYLALAMVLQRWFGEIPRPDGVSSSAAIDPAASIGTGCRIAPFVSIGRNAVIGDRVTLFPGVSIGDGAHIGSDTTIHANASIYHSTVIGERCIIHSNAVIGSDGYGFATANGRHNKIPQIGIVRIGDDVEIGANTSIDRAALGETTIGDGTKIDNLVQIAHNVKIGKHCLIISQAGIAGSTELGDYVVLAGQVGVVGHLKIGSGVQVAGKSVVSKSWEGPAKLGGNPARPLREFHRTEALVHKLGDLYERVRELERLVIAVATKKNN